MWHFVFKNHEFRGLWDIQRLKEATKNHAILFFALSSIPQSHVSINVPQWKKCVLV